ncbi:MAG: beta-propeller domain-containing protein [Candidatus Moraniibacteriota bacterium]|nr:MAG: beta-propeller domain-containing protein [Candidatus Moranbacteria bacterium]
MEKKMKIFLSFMGGLALVSIFFILFDNFYDKENSKGISIFESEKKKDESIARNSIKQFSSEEEFKQYLENAEKYEMSTPRNFGESVDKNSLMMGSPNGNGGDMPFTLESKKGDSTNAGRFSQTNVQVVGIDEPDIVKTDGKEIYYSRENERYYFYDDVTALEPRGISFEENEKNQVQIDALPPSISPPSSILPPREPIENDSETSLIKAFPIDEMVQNGKIKKTGKMLLFENMLVIFSGNDIFGFDISNVKNPIEKWKIASEENTSLVQSRKLDKELYVVSNTFINKTHPCPLYPLSLGVDKISIPCNEIYYPSSGRAFINSTYSISVINPKNGSLRKSMSFVGSLDNSTLYMNKDFLYIAYGIYGDFSRSFLNFIMEQEDLFSPEALKRVEKIAQYDISQESKMLEFGKVMEDESLFQNEDDQLKFSNELENRMSLFGEKHKREMYSTEIVKIAIKNLEINSTGIVPGRLLNQFSLDEYEGTLRVATTIDGSFFGGSESSNDVYILGKNLEERGSIKDLGLGEQIYSARFLGDMGYVVTFRQTDPFYVLDLSNPDKPRKAGELKIPGYSSYLHPLEKNLILGIGMEEGKVKLSLFDVSSPDNPREVSKYLLKEYFSEATNNHNAFLADPKNKIFFLPGSEGGYVFSYNDGELKMKLASGDKEIQRAVYIDKYLYVIGKKSISVYDQKNWTKAKEFTF